MVESFGVDTMMSLRDWGLDEDAPEACPFEHLKASCVCLLKSGNEALKQQHPVVLNELYSYTVYFSFPLYAHATQALTSAVGSFLSSG